MEEMVKVEWLTSFYCRKSQADAISALSEAGSMKGMVLFAFDLITEADETTQTIRVGGVDTIINNTSSNDIK